MSEVMSQVASSGGAAVGGHLREWRQRRRMSQLDLACEAEVSSRHLSFVETGRAQPSREMILRLAERLEVPMRERNVLLVAGGFAPVFPERSLESPELAAAKAALDILLEGHRPYPAFAVDRHWNIVATNGALPQLYDGVDPSLLAPPVNALRLSLHPHGLGRRIENLAEWLAHIEDRLRRQIDLTADAGLIDLLDEVRGYGRALVGPGRPRPAARAAPEMIVPFRIRIGGEAASFFTTTMVFGTPVEVTLSELALESFFPADASTAALVKLLSGSSAE
jgi:transcriptional regulator with XRE-family HTH domain